LGALVGWRGAGASSNWDHFSSNTWDMYAYPGTNWDMSVDLGGDRMFRQTGNYDYDDYPQIGSDRPSFRGTSGGGAIKDGAVWAVRSHGIEPWPGDVDTYDTAISHTKLSTILAWMDSDRPNSPDLLPLDVKVSPESGVSGSTLSSLSFLVHNLGESDHSGGVAYTIYIGTGAVTSQSDTYVTSGYVSNVIAAGGVRQVTVPNVVIPPELATGQYNLGVFITTNDANYGNNMTREQDTAPFTVTCAGAATPQPVFPVDGHPCVPTNLTLNWGSVPGIGVLYEVFVGEVASPQGESLQLSSTQHTFYGFSPGTEYRWRVRASSACGGWGNWSQYFTFTTSSFVGPVVAIAPDAGEKCLDPTVQLEWNGLVNGDQYLVRLENMDHPGVQTFLTGATSLVVNELTPGDRYEWKVRAQDPCLVWGPYGPTQDFFIKDVPAADGEPWSPINSAFTSTDPVFVLIDAPGALEYHYEVRTEEEGDPVAAWMDTFHSGLTGLAEGPYEWRARALACTISGNVFGAWSDWEGFRVDTTQPVFAGSPTAISPPVGVWTSNALVTVDFPAATDYAGIGEYWILVDQSPDSVPDGSITSATFGGWEFTAPDGENWFHVVAVDIVGNVSAVKHLGPFLIDTGPPSDPVPVANLQPTTPTNVDDIVVTWPASTDAGSGVAGYSFAWSTSATYQLDATVDTVLPTAEQSPAPEGNRWFYVRAVDNLGNAGATVAVRYQVDRTPPWFKDLELAASPPLLTGQNVNVEYMVQDNFGPATVYTLHYYSVDGGAFWYDALRNGSTSCNGGGGTLGTPNCGNAWGPYEWQAPWFPPGSSLLYKVVAIDRAGNAGDSIIGPFATSSPTSAEGLPAVTSYSLVGNVPNPFNPRTVIRYAVPEPAEVRLSIYDLQGRLVRTLVRDKRDGPAWYEASWDGTADEGQRVASGVYFYRMEAGDFVETKRMTLLK